VAPDNIKEIQAHVLAWTYEEDTQERGKTVTKEYLQMEIHERGRITTAKYPIENNIIGPAIGDMQKSKLALMSFWLFR